MGFRCRSSSGGAMICALEAVYIPETSFEKSADEAGEESQKAKCLQRLLQRTLAHSPRRIPKRTPIVIVVLDGKDKRREPEVGKDPSKRGKVSLVRPDQGGSESRQIEEGVNGGESDPVAKVGGVGEVCEEVGCDTEYDDGGDEVEDVVGCEEGAVQTVGAAGRCAVVVCW